jgi:hypothetical protein
MKTLINILGVIYLLGLLASVISLVVIAVKAF